MPETTRFAPSPTGWLHLGHAYAALYAQRAAIGGQLLLRIEDLDKTRARPEFTTGIYEDLAWLGLKWELPVLCQSSRSEAYRMALAQLAERGVTYPCFCTRREIAFEVSRAAEAPHVGEAGTLRYAGTCRHLSEAERALRLQRGDLYAVRLDAARAAALCGETHFEESGHSTRDERELIRVEPSLFGDIVLARKGLPAAYHLAVVVDDAFQSVTLVTRGADLFLATHMHATLQRLLGLRIPRYRHHRLIRDEHQNKLSKRHQSTSLRMLRESGLTAEQVRQRLGF